MAVILPKLAIGSATPDGPLWVVRLRNPFLLGLAEQTGLCGLSLLGWPPEAPHQTTEKKIAKCFHGLAALWADYLDEDDSALSWSFPLDLAPPPYLLIEAPSSDWEGILEPERRILWVIEDGPDGTTSILWESEFGGEPTFPEDTRAVSAFYRAFQIAEEEME